MDAVMRGAAVYLFLMIVFRVAGRRSLTEITTFDFVLLLIISEATQQAMLGEDFSVTGGFLLILTLVGLDIGMSLLVRAWPQLARWIDGVPMLLIEKGKVHEDRLRRARVDISEIMSSARELQGIERLEQIKHAVLERNGRITVVPKETRQEIDSQNGPQN